MLLSYHGGNTPSFLTKRVRNKGLRVRDQCMCIQVKVEDSTRGYTRRTRARGSLAVNWTKSDDVAVRIVGHEITPISSARRHLEPQRYNRIGTTLHGFSFSCASPKRVQLPWRSARPTSFHRNKNRTRDEIRLEE